MSRKVGAIRQLSLQYDQSPAYQSRRSSLRKQHSEEIPGGENLGIRISLSAKNRPIKLAWTEAAKNCETAEKSQTKRAETVKDSILNPRQDLVERLRQAWHDTDKKQNLNIDLNIGSVGSKELQHDPDESPKIILPLQPDLHQTDLKQIFHKQIRKKLPSNTHQSESEPQRPVVVIPIIERPRSQKSLQNSNSTLNIVIRPHTAALRRDQFQKRNSTFNTSLKSEPRPPLLRSSSVPTRAEAKPKFLASKRRLKPTKRKDSTEDDEIKSDCKKSNDIVTMVSLVSPSGSDNDESSVKDTPKIKLNLPANFSKKENEQKIFSLRKTVKSVSFQQSSIHAVRSFSASFPARRGSAATTLLLGNAAKKLINHVQLNQEKRAPNGHEGIDPKRRLMRSHSVTESTLDLEDEDDGKELKSKQGNSATGVNQEKNPKEKECYDMFCKMNEKGLNVSLDTILRGMLTPTEYRLRRKQEQEISSDDKTS